jgi:hypothetical protein
VDYQFEEGNYFRAIYLNFQCDIQEIYDLPASKELAVGWLTAQLAGVINRVESHQ